MAKKKIAPAVNPVNAKAVNEPVKTQPTAGHEPKAFAEHWYIIILLALAFLINAPTISYDYTLDDPFFTKENPLVREGMASIPEFFQHAAYYGVFKNHDASYRPLLLTSFAIEKEVVGEFSPKVGHFVNLVLFCLQLFALFRLLRRVFNNYSIYVPFFIVLLFELHPIHTEVIASIKSRDEIMALLFGSMCMLQSFKYIDDSKAKNLILSGVYFFLALMSKETPICFVAIMPITIYFFRNASLKKIITALSPYLVVTAVYMAMRMAFIESDGEKVRILVNNNALMAATSYSEKLATALFIQLKYIILLILPHPLSWDYSFNQIPIIGLGDVKALSAIVVLLGLLAYSLKTLKAKSVFSYSILFYFAFVALTANIIVDIGATMAERFIYTASLGYCIALVFLVLKLLKADLTKINHTNASGAFAIFAVIAVLYSVKTVARNADWKNNLVLYESGAETAPESWRVHNLLGVEYTKMIRNENDPVARNEVYRKAVDHLTKSSAILSSPEVWLIRGYAYDFGGKDDSAIYCYRVVLQIDKNNNQAVNNVGAIYLRRNMFDSSIKILGDFVRKDSTQTDILGNLAAAYGNSGHFPEAIKYYEMALRIDPNQPPNVFSSLVNIHRLMGDSVKTQYYQRLLVKSQEKR